jgi:hypothetical protein
VAESFDFSIPEPVIALDAERRGVAVIDVTSRLDGPELVGVDVKPEDGVDGSWFTEPKPSELDLAVGETSRTELEVQVPAGVAPGDHRFSVRAFAVNDPSETFSVSPSLVVRVPEPSPDTPSVPTWLLVTVAALVVGTVALVGYLALGRQREVIAPDLVALDAAEARRIVGGDVELVEHAADLGEEPGCVFLQAPLPGRSTSSISVLLVPCPQQSTSVPLPTGAATLCSTYFSFCADVAAHYGPGFAEDEEWREGSSAMSDRFVGAFQLPGEPAPDLVGLREVRARQVVEDAGLDLSTVADGSGGAQCVLLQHPAPAEPVAAGAVLAAVSTRCPVGAAEPDGVVLSTPIDVETFEDVCEVVAAWCDDVRAGGGPDHRDGSEPTDGLEAMVTLFRNAFSGSVVPDLLGLDLGTARAELGELGLEARYAFPVSPENEFSMQPCWQVNGQSPPPGTLIGSLGDDIVVLAVEPSDPCEIVPLEPTAPDDDGS